jgi:hypothetical protein
MSTTQNVGDKTEGRDPREYKAQVCFHEGCQWREKCDQISKLHERIRSLEAQLQCVREAVK